MVFEHPSHTQLPSVIILRNHRRMGNTAFSHSYLSFQENFDHTTTDVCNIYLSASYGVVERLSHKVFDHASTTEFRKHICENSDLYIKIAIATQISVRNKTDRHSFDNICQGVSYVWQGYCPTFGKGIVQRLARALSNVWQSFFQRLTKVLSNV